jgi:hypothetical protein
MGLDQWAYVSGKKNAGYSNHREIAYWRKHPSLQGWMEQLWLEKNGVASDRTDQFIEGKQLADFNGIELELAWQDLDNLEWAIQNNALPNTTGFFFGNPKDEYYKEYDLEFVKNARAEIFVGLKVFYNSSW